MKSQSKVVRMFLALTVCLAAVLSFIVLAQQDFAAAQSDEDQPTDIDETYLLPVFDELRFTFIPQHLFNISLSDDNPNGTRVPIILRLYDSPDGKPEEAIWQESISIQVFPRIRNTTITIGNRENEVSNSEANYFRELFDGSPRFIGISLKEEPSNEYRQPIEVVQYAEQADIARAVASTLGGSPSSSFSLYRHTGLRMSQFNDSMQLVSKWLRLENDGDINFPVSSEMQAGRIYLRNPIRNLIAEPDSIKFFVVDPAGPIDKENYDTYVGVEGVHLNKWQDSAGNVNRSAALTGTDLRFYDTPDRTGDLDTYVGIDGVYLDKWKDPAGNEDRSASFTGSQLRFFDSPNRTGIYGVEIGGEGISVWDTKGESSVRLFRDGDIYVPNTTSTGILEIRGGADLAEHFAASSDEPILPGTVMSIDSDRPGELRPSNKPYDSMVAGVVSGAGELDAGIVLGHSGDEGNYPIALTGRAYVWANASNGEISPGDLLTTSNVIGQAMKVTDHSRSQGAIMGKAMSALNEGSGLVLVLVALQ